MFKCLVTLFLLPILFSSNQRSETDIREIVTKVVTAKQTTYYLDAFLPLKPHFYFHYGQFPLYNGTLARKVTFSFPYKQGYKVRYAASVDAKADNVFIIIDSISVDKGKATVRIRIPKQGVYGSFVLERERKGPWRIKSAEVYET